STLEKSLVIRVAPNKTSMIYGVAGTIRLLTGNYALVITSRTEVGTYLGFPVYRVTSMRFLSYNEGMKNSTAQEKKDEAYFMALLKTVQSTPGLYFSYKTDITLNFQRCKLVEGWMAKPIWKQADPRFVWNINLLDELIEYKLNGFITPLIQGNILNLLILLLMLINFPIYIGLSCYAVSPRERMLLSMVVGKMSAIRDLYLKVQEG
ncbi:phosphoinositide phosphatase SAC8-like, partial [Pyrus communis]|uniref:phosphoinositide phosphatase SAC8-like n=1 Tax=Pyrus communis TaxID=23211 RepID=UPI0035C12E4B